VAIAVLISSFALGDRDPALAANGINNVISFIAPQLVQYQKAVSDEEFRRTPAKPELPAAGPAAPATSTARPRIPRW